MTNHALVLSVLSPFHYECDEPGTIQHNTLLNVSETVAEHMATRGRRLFESSSCKRRVGRLKIT